MSTGKEWSIDSVGISEGCVYLQRWGEGEGEEMGHDE